METIIFLNQFLEPIISNQASMSKEYVKQGIENNITKIKELYKYGVLSHITYYLKNNKEQNQIRLKYPNLPMTFYKTDLESGIYKKYLVEDIDKNGIVTNKYIEVYGHRIYPIYYKVFDIITNSVLIFQQTFYDEQNEITYEFEYDKYTGEFSKLNIYDPLNTVDTDDHTILPNEIGKGNNPYNFSWIGFEYYQNAEPTIPN